MSHMLLILEPAGQRGTRTEAQGREAYASMQRFGESLRSRGKLLAAESLASQSQGVRVHTGGGKAQVVDGPFAEAKEMIGGFSCWTAPAWTRPWPSPRSARPPNGPPSRCAPWGRVTTTAGAESRPQGFSWGVSVGACRKPRGWFVVPVEDPHFNRSS